MPDIKTDPSTGLPELPKGYTWKVYRNSKIRILRNGLRTKYKANLPEVFSPKHIDDRAGYLASKFYHEREQHEKVEEKRKEFKNFTTYLDKYKTNLPELKVGFRWRLLRRYQYYYYLEIVQETGFRTKVLASSEMYDSDVFPLLFDTYEESLQVDSDWAEGHHNPENLFSRKLSRDALWDFNRVYNKYLMYHNDFGVLGTFDVDGHPNLYYTVEWLEGNRSRSLNIRLHGKIRSFGEMPIYLDYTNGEKRFLEDLNKHIKKELEFLLRQKALKEKMKSLVGKYPPKTLRKDSDH